MPELSVDKITKYEAKDKTLKVTETPVKIVPIEKTYNIAEVKERLAKRIVYRDQCQKLVDEDQAILDKYNELTDGGTK